MLRIALSIALLLVAGSAQAGLVRFDTRAAFRRAAGPVTNEGFEHCARRTTAFTGPLDSVHANAACSAGAIAGGLQLVDDPGPDGLAMFLAAPRYTGNRSHAVGQNSPARDALNLNFTNGTRAAGFDLFQNFGGGAQLGHAAPFEVLVYADADLLGAFTVNVPTGRGAFFGVASDARTITHVSVNNPLAYDTVDNVSFSAPVALRLAALATAPEPGAVALLGIAATLITISRRR